MNMGFSIKGKRNDIILGMTLGLFMMAFGFVVLESLGEIQFSRINYDLSSIIWLFILFIGTLGEQAERLQASLPSNQVFVTLHTSEIPTVLKRIFTSNLLKFSSCLN